MMPFDTYRLSDAERPRSVAELRAADQQSGELAAALARSSRSLVDAGLHLAGAVRSGWLVLLRRRPALAGAGVGALRPEEGRG